MEAQREQIKANQAMSQLVAQTLSSHVKTDSAKTGEDASTGDLSSAGGAAGTTPGNDAAATSGGSGATTGGTPTAPGAGAQPPQNPLERAKQDLANFFGDDAEKVALKTQVRGAQDWESLSGILVGALSREEIIELSGNLGVEVTAGAKRRAIRTTLLDTLNGALWKCEE